MHIRAHTARRTVVLVALALAQAACGDGLRPVDKGPIESSTSSALYFDLEEKPAVAAAVIVPGTSPKPELKLVVLPFGTEPVGTRSEAFSLWGTSGDATALAYVATPNAPAYISLALRPRFSSGDDTDFDSANLAGSLHFMSSGLKRRFFYSWPNPSVESESLQNLRGLTRIEIQSILVKLPPKAEVFERPASSLPPQLEKTTPDGKLKLYSLTSEAAGTPLPVDITYQVPATKLQNHLFEFFLKLFAVLIAPLVTLLMLSSNKEKTRRLRRISLIVGFTLEAFVLIGMAWWAIHISSTIGLTAILDLTLVIVGLIATFVLARVKGE